MSEYSSIPPAAQSNWLWRSWQAVIVPLFYPLFGIACALLLLLVPLAHVALRNEAKRTRWFRYALHHVARSWFALARTLRVFDYKISAPQHLGALEPLLAPAQPHPGHGLGHLVIANHPTLIDVLMVLSLMPNLCCVMKSDLRQHPILGLLIRNLNYLSNDNPEHWLLEAQARLESGESLLVFPEGTRTLPGERVNFKLGAAELALRSGAPLVPVVMHYSSNYLSKSCPWYALPQHKIQYQLEIGPCLTAAGLVGPTTAAPATPSVDTLAPQTSKNTAHSRQSRRWLNHQLQTYFRDRLGRSQSWSAPPVRQHAGKRTADGVAFTEDDHLSNTSQWLSHIGG